MTVPVTLRVRALIVREEHLLLCRLKSRSVAFLPGGRVESGEILESAMRRELVEETGSDPGELRYLGVIEHLWTEGRRPIHDLNHFFHASCGALQPSVVPRCDDEDAEMFWVPRRALRGQPIKPNAAIALIEGWLSGDRGIWWATENDA